MHLQASGLPVHVTCVNSYLAALLKEVGAASTAPRRPAAALGAEAARAAGKVHGGSGRQERILLNSLGRLQDGLEAAVNLFQRMKVPGSGVRPNTITYNLLMGACLASDQAAQVGWGKGGGCSAIAPPGAAPKRPHRDVVPRLPAKCCPGPSIHGTAGPAPP